MKKNSLLSGIAAAALATTMAGSAEAQESLALPIIKAISSVTTDDSADDHDGPAGDRNHDYSAEDVRIGDRHY